MTPGDNIWWWPWQCWGWVVLYDLGGLFQPKQSHDSKASPGKELWIQTRTVASHVNCPPMDMLVSHGGLRDRSSYTQNPHLTGPQWWRTSSPAGKVLKGTTPFQKEKRERRLKFSWTSPLSPPFDFMGSEMLPICPRWPLLFFNWKGQRVLTTYQNSYLGNISFPVASALSLFPPSFSDKGTVTSINGP